MDETQQASETTQDHRFAPERTFFKDPASTLIVLSRYKFASKMLSSKDTVLDLGCGTGYGAYFMSKYARKVIAIDLQISRLPEAAKAKNLLFLQGDIRRPPPSLANEKVTAVTAIDVIEHFEKEEGERILQRYARWLPPYGMMILGTPSRHSSAYRSQDAKDQHRYEYDPEELRNLCDRHFSRTLLFSMNDEIVHTGFPKLAWFFFVLCFNSNSSRRKSCAAPRAPGR
jgi:cyclopropane fatty-acyl-phospholipid synthase-like methyltransferase